MVGSKCYVDVGYDACPLSAGLLPAIDISDSDRNSGDETHRHTKPKAPAKRRIQELFNRQNLLLPSCRDAGYETFFNGPSDPCRRQGMRNWKSTLTQQPQTADAGVCVSLLAPERLLIRLARPLYFDCNLTPALFRISATDR